MGEKRDELRLYKQISYELSHYTYEIETSKKDNIRAFYFLIYFNDQLKCEKTYKPLNTPYRLEVLTRFEKYINCEDYKQAVSSLQELSCKFGLLPENIKFHVNHVCKQL